MSRGTCCRNDRNTRRWPSGEMTTLELPTCDERIVTASPRSISTRIGAAGSGLRSRHGDHAISAATAMAPAAVSFHIRDSLSPEEVGDATSKVGT